MSRDFNHPNYPAIEEPPSDSEKHKEDQLGAYLSNVPTDEHPFFGTTGVVDTINHARRVANSLNEKELTGKTKDKAIEDIAKAARKTRIPYDFLLFLCDWEKDITSRSDAGDAEGIAKKVTNMIPELRNTLGRDPFAAEIFAGYITGSASKVKTIIENAEKKPDEEAKPLGTKKDNIIMIKNRNNKEKKRTNYELYEFFKRRINVGQNSFNDYVKENAYENT